MDYNYTGLTTHQVMKNIIEFGSNTLPEKKRDSFLMLMLKQFENPLVYVLLIAGLVTAILGDYSDAIIILIVTIINSFIGAFQTNKANNVIESLKNLSASKASVIRDGTLQTISIDEVAVGDYVVLSPGVLIPADGILIESTQLRINESKLNGESMPVEKNDENNKVYRSTVVVAGSGVCEITSVGVNTEIGKLGQSIMENISNPTFLEKQVTKLTRIILGIVLSSTILVFVIGRVRGIELFEILKTSVSLAVSAIPEGLPIVLSIVLAIGAWRIQKVQGLLKNLPSGATLATVSTVCTDKTGTLTLGYIAVKSILNKSELETQTLNSYILHSLDVKLVSGQIIGDILDQKMYEYFDERQKWKTTKELPFDSENKFNAKEYEINDSHIQLYKGAPELFTQNLEEVNELTRQGYRVLAVSMRTVSRNTDFDPEKSSLLAYIVFEDPIRPHVNEAVHDLKKAGVSIMMITGDNINTANHVASHTGILSSEQDLSLLGSDIDALNDIQLAKLLPNLKVLARATPSNKYRIIDLLQKSGEIVAMTGDGVNDGPSIALSDIGIAMGKSGTEVAKEAADFILVSDDFSNIRDGIFEARTIFENIRKTVMFLFSTSLSEILIIGGSIIAGFPPALLPAQILWLNLITDGLMDVAIANEPSERHYKYYTHQHYQSGLLHKYNITRILIMALTMSVSVFIYFIYSLKNRTLLEVQTLMLVLMSVMQWLNAINVRKEFKSIVSYNLLQNKLFIGIFIFEVVLLYLSVNSKILSTLLQTTQINVRDILLVCAIAPIILIADELYKYYIRKNRNHAL